MTRRTTLSVAWTVCLILAASVSPVVAQEEPSFQGLESAPGVDQPAHPDDPSTPALGGASPASPDEPFVPSNYLQEAGGSWASSKDFDPAKDTPAFNLCEAAGIERSDPRNFASNLLTVEWFQRLVIPVENQESWSQFIDQGGAEVERQLRRSGLITQSSPEGFRLEAYSSDAGNRENLIEKTRGYDRDFGTWFNTEETSDGGSLLFQMQEDIQDSNSQIALVNLYSADQSEGRSLLVYRIEMALLAIPGQEPEPAFKAYFYDPAVPLSFGLNSANHYLFLVKSTGTWSVSPEWADSIRRRTGVRFLSGTWLADGQLRFQPTNGAASRWVRNFHHRNDQSLTATGN